MVAISMKGSIYYISNLWTGKVLLSVASSLPFHYIREDSDFKMAF